MQQQMYRRAVRTPSDAVAQAVADRIAEAAHREAVVETLRRNAQRNRAVRQTLRAIDREA